MTKEKLNTPTLDQVKEWVKRDAVASHYFLGILISNPDILASCAEQIYEHGLKIGKELEPKENAH